MGQKINLNISSDPKINLGISGSKGSNNYNVLTNKPQINGVTLQGDLSIEELGLTIDTDISPTSTNPLENKAVYEAIATAVEGLELKIPAILYDTKEHWDAQSIISEANTIYIYTDLREDSAGRKIAGFKVGDGSAYLSDLPFLDEIYYEHINDSEIHITDEEREFWNNKVRCYMSLTAEENLVFTTT